VTSSWSFIRQLMPWFTEKRFHSWMTISC